MWFADDSTRAGKIRALKEWWDHLKEVGPNYGYYPKPSKTYLIIKKEELLVQAKEIFAVKEIKFISVGHRHLRAVIGTEDIRDDVKEIGKMNER